MEMHTLLHSTLESSAKSTEKLNILKDKLANSENLITVLTQKVILNFKSINLLEVLSFYLLFRILTKLQN